MSRTNKQPRQIRVTGKPRKEPDVRRIAKAIIQLSLDADDANDRFAALEDTERAIARRRQTKSGQTDQPEGLAS
jgi:hypothetical protein